MPVQTALSYKNKTLVCLHIDTHNHIPTGLAQAEASYLSRASQSATQRVETQTGTSGSWARGPHTAWSQQARTPERSPQK